MNGGRLVVVDWRYAWPETGEPSKLRPAIVVGSAAVFDGRFPYEMVVPLTATAALEVEGATMLITPTPMNGLAKPSLALAWNVQTVPHARLRVTPHHCSATVLAGLRAQVRYCLA